MKQIRTILMLNILSLPSRALMSLAAVIAVASVVAVLMGFLAMAGGFAKTVNSSGSEDVGVITRKGSQSELNSVLENAVFDVIQTLPGIKRDNNNQPIISGELYVIVDGIKRDSGTEANLPLRGIDQVGLTLRDNIAIKAGRMFTPGKNEIIVGSGVLRSFDGFELGRTLKLANSTWSVVGVFDSGGSVFESELWADARVIQTQFRRTGSVQTARLRLDGPTAVARLEEAIEADPRLNLTVQSEKDYFASQSSALNYIVSFGWALSGLMALGALAGALNTMNASVDARAREIATLRTIGFGSGATFVGTLAESIALSIVGGFLGVIVAFFFIDGITTSTIGSSFSQVVFSFDVTPDSMLQGLMMAVTVGLIGGLPPAWRASRIGLAKAFRG